MKRSSIPWTDYSGGDLNFVRRGQAGDCETSEGCRFCYARRIGERFGNLPEKTTVYPEKLERLLKLNLPQDGNRRGPHSRPMCFVVDTGDLFHPAVPEDFIADAFVVMGRREDIIWQVLTKRAERMNDFVTRISWKAHYIGPNWGYVISFPLPNLWLGVTICNQAEADRNIPLLLATPAAVRFVSVEPMLEEIDLSQWLGGIQNGSVSEQRRSGLSSSEGRGTKDRPTRSDMANRDQAGRSLVGWDAAPPMQGAKGGTRHGDIPPSESHAQRCQDVCPSPSADLVSLHGADTDWNDDQPQERRQARQSTGESGVGNAGGSDKACAEGPASWTDRPVRREECNVEADGRTGNRDAQAQSRRGTPPGDCEGIRSDIPDCIEDRQGRELGISWVVCGCESGPSRRPAPHDWFRDLRDQCQAAGVPYFCKQLSEHEDGTGRIVHMPALDGKAWQEWPR